MSHAFFKGMSGTTRRFRTALLATLIMTVVAVAQTAPAPQPTNLTPRFQRTGLAIDQLQAFEIGGVVVIRGRTTDRAVAEEAGRVAQSLGYARVANLVQVVPPPDDATIRRLAERELSTHRSLDGCSFHVDSQNGIVRVAGSVEHELQKDYAIELLRNIYGVRAVQSDLKRR